MNDLISRKKLIENIEQQLSEIEDDGSMAYMLTVYCAEKFKQIIRKQPTVETCEDHADKQETLQNIAENLEKMSNSYAGTDDEYLKGKQFAYSNAARYVKRHIDQ